jgi:glycosyltransferase involved in cell wall biosynthesis
MEGLRQIRLALVTVKSASGMTGGAEKHYEGILQALNHGPVAMDHVALVADESDFHTILEAYLRFYEEDLSSYDGVISTKAPSFMVRHRNHVCWLLHTIRVFYDMFDREFPDPPPELVEQRRFIQRADTIALSAPHIRKLFVNGEEVRQRLVQFNALDATVLHPPLLHDCFQDSGYDEGYAFVVSRLHRWKRVSLVIEAMKYVKSPMRLLIAGTGEDECALRQLAGNDARIEFLGQVSDDAIVRYYSRARLVPFVPVREDFGYITLEAFQSGKPVVTCEDSGEPARLVRHGISGFISKAEPMELARHMDYLFEHPSEAKAMGAHGLDSVRPIQWAAVRSRLMSALGY